MGRGRGNEGGREKQRQGEEGERGGGSVTKPPASCAHVSYNIIFWSSNFGVASV